jgi:hypothetical protein
MIATMRALWRLAFVLLLASASCATAPPATPRPPAAPAQPPAASAAAKEEPPTVGGGLTPQMVADYVRAQAPMVRACYDRQVEKKRDVSGKLVIRWTIDEMGGTGGILVELNTMHDTAVAECLEVVIRGWRFAKPPGGPVNVALPFTFQAIEGITPPQAGPAPPKTSV